MAGGKRDGAAGGEIGSTTQGVAGALGWWGVLQLGKTASAAAAIARLISNADISGAGESLFKAAARIGKNAAKLAKEATEIVDHLVEHELKQIAEAPEFLAKTAAEQKALLDAARADLTQATRVRVAQHLDQQIAEYDKMAAEYTGDYADDFRAMAKKDADQLRDARAALGDVETPPPMREAAEPKSDGSKTKGTPEDQLSTRGLTNPTELTGDELARVNDYQQVRNQYLKR